MRGSIAAHAAVALLLLLGFDLSFPLWPVHIGALLLAIIVLLLAFLAWVAVGRRRE